MRVPQDQEAGEELSPFDHGRGLDVGQKHAGNDRRVLGSLRFHNEKDLLSWSSWKVIIHQEAWKVVKLLGTFPFLFMKRKIKISVPSWTTAPA